jgi:hypothetical protein
MTQLNDALVLTLMTFLRCPENTIVLSRYWQVGPAELTNK